MKNLLGIDRVMLFLELVKGCTNSKCPSFKTQCSFDGDYGLEFMSQETLQKIINEIMEYEYIGNSVRVDIWAYGCGDSLLHPNLDVMAKIIQQLPYKKTIAIDSNCWKQNTGWGNILAPVVLFKEGSFEPDQLSQISKKWNYAFNGPQFGFILKTLTVEMLRAIRSFQWNRPFVKVRSFHYVPLGTNMDYHIIGQYSRPDIVIDPDIPISRIQCLDKKAIRVMYRYDGSLRRCLISSSPKTSLSEFLDGDLSDCDQCFPHMAGEQLLIFRDKIILIEKARCVSDKS